MTEKEQVLTALDRVAKDGLNIYALINRLKNRLGWGKDEHFPESVLLKVCDSYLKNKDIKNDWAWFTVAMAEELKLYHANEKIRKNEEYKKCPMAQSVRDVLAGIGSQAVER